jgi:hypothetical protein
MTAASVVRKQQSSTHSYQKSQSEQIQQIKAFSNLTQSQDICIMVDDGEVPTDIINEDQEDPNLYYTFENKLAVNTTDD